MSSETTPPDPGDWPFRVRRRPDGSIGLLLGDREHVMGEAQAEIAARLLLACAAGQLDDTGATKL